ncbi:MAG: glycosyltransferase [Acidilobus sp.]
MSAVQPSQLMLTFKQYLDSVHITIHLNPESAAMAYAAGSALTVGVALLVELVIIIHGLPRGSQRTRPPGASGMPLVSVIVPTYRDGERLVRVVRSLLAQDYPGDLYEVIVAGEVDDPTLPGALARLGLPPEDGSSAVVSGVRVRVSLSPRARGKPAALDRALALARGEVIGVMDSDGVAPRDAISRAVAALLSGYEAAQLPRELAVPVDARRGLTKAYVRAQAAEMRLYNRVLAPALMGFTGSAWLTGSGYFVWRVTLEGLGGWNPFAPTEDLDLSVRLLSSGGRIAFLGGAPIVEEPLTSLRAMIRQKERWVRGSLLATLTAIRGVRRTWPLLLFFIMPAWGYLMTPWVALLAIAGLNPQLLTWTLAWSSAWLAPILAYYALALRRGGRTVRPLPAAIGVYLLAGMLALPKLALRRNDWTGSRT